MATINTETVDKLSKLSKCSVPDDQREQLVEDLSAIVSFIDKLSEADTNHVTPLHTTLELSQTPVNKRDDVVIESDERSVLQALAPEAEDGLYLVPEVLD